MVLYKKKLRCCIVNIYESEIINIIDRIESKEEMWKAILEISFYMRII